MSVKIVFEVIKKKVCFKIQVTPLSQFCNYFKSIYRSQIHFFEEKLINLHFSCFLFFAYYIFIYCKNDAVLTKIHFSNIGLP
jgi:hypothetical protein